MGLSDDIRTAKSKASSARCSLCAAIAAVEDKGDQDSLADAAAGSIGRDTLITILKNNDITDPINGRAIGHRVVVRHRTEEHQWDA